MPDEQLEFGFAGWYNSAFPDEGIPVINQEMIAAAEFRSAENMQAFMKVFMGQKGPDLSSTLEEGEDGEPERLTHISYKPQFHFEIVPEDILS